MNEDVDEPLEEELPTGEVEAPEGEETPAGPTLADFEGMKAQLEALKSAESQPSGDVAELVQMGKAFLAAQSRPKEDPNAGAADLARWGEQIQKAALTGTPEELGGLLLRAVNEVSQSKIDQALQERGAPVAAKAAKFAVSSFLNDMRDEVGDERAELHKNIAKQLPGALNAREKEWVATADDAQVDQFLRSKYKQLAGDILLNTKPARPADIGDKGRSALPAGSGGATIMQLVPGIPRKDAVRFEKLAESYWPDPKVRATKIKAWAKNMNDAMASGE